MFFLDFSQTVHKLRYFPQLQGTLPQSQRTGKKTAKHATLYSHKACLNLNNNKEILIFLNTLLNLYFLTFDKYFFYTVCKLVYHHLPNRGSLGVKIFVGVLRG